MTVEAYLARIGYQGPLQPAAETLARLHAAHLMTVPFENLDIHASRPIVLDLAHLYRKIVEQHRGGFCYELNGLFAWLLTELGFSVKLLSAGVAHPEGGFGPEFDHLLLQVDLEQPLLADVGFGECFHEPLPLAEGGKAPYRLERTGDWWTLWRDANPQYRFTTTPRTLAEFSEMCHYHQTSPNSSFTRDRIATIARDEGRITLSGTRLIRTRGEVRVVEVLEDAAAAALLRDEFGLALPFRIRALEEADWDAVRRIYEEGIATGQATFETDAPDWEAWDAAHLSHCRLVAAVGAHIAGWAALSPVSRRAVYRGVAEVSIYVGEQWRRLGAGRQLMEAVIAESERQGVWTLQSVIFPENAASTRLNRAAGFREVGRRERIAQRDGVWRDTVLLERRSRLV